MKYPANYDHWNKFSTLTIDQCIYLTLGIEPGSPLTKKQQKRFDIIRAKAKKAVASGELKIAARSCRS